MHLEERVMFVMQIEKPNRTYYFVNMSSVNRAAYVSKKKRYESESSVNQSRVPGK